MKPEMRQKLAENHLRRKSEKSGNSSGWRKLFPAAPPGQAEPALPCPPGPGEGCSMKISEERLFAALEDLVSPEAIRSWLK